MNPAKLLALLPLALIWFTTTNSTLGQTWRESVSLYPASWSSVVSSADGSKVLVVGSIAGQGVVYSSADSGTTWVSNSAPFARSTRLASSADLTRLVAVVSDGAAWTSANGGATWEAVPGLPSIWWSSAASSTNGTTLVIAALSGQVSTNGGPVQGDGSIFTSTDSGVTWRSNTVPCNCSPNPAWSSVASSADGARLVAAGGGAGLYQSANAGTNWSQLTAPFGYAVAVASSADGIRLLATGIDELGNNVWAVSTDSGQSWTTTIAPAGGNSWPFVSSSADGTQLIAVDPYNSIYTSTDAGASWVVNADPREGPFPGTWRSVASSADGRKLIALADFGKVYTWQYQPLLSLTVSVTNATLSWRRSSLVSGFVLQQNSSLSRAGWVDVASPISDDGTNLTVTCGPPTNVLFFRLKR